MHLTDEEILQIAHEAREHAARLPPLTDAQRERIQQAVSLYVDITIGRQEDSA